MAARREPDASSQDPANGERTSLEVRYARAHWQLNQSRRRLIRGMLDNPEETFFLSVAGDGQAVRRRCCDDRADHSSFGLRPVRRFRNRLEEALRCASDALCGNEGGSPGETQPRRSRPAQHRAGYRKPQRAQVESRSRSRPGTVQAHAPLAAHSDRGGRSGGTPCRVSCLWTGPPSKDQLNQ